MFFSTWYLRYQKLAPEGPNTDSLYETKLIGERIALICYEITPACKSPNKPCQGILPCDSYRQEEKGRRMSLYLSCERFIADVVRSGFKHIDLRVLRFCFGFRYRPIAPCHVDVVLSGGSIIPIALTGCKHDSLASERSCF